MPAGGQWGDGDARSPHTAIRIMIIARIYLKLYGQIEEILGNFTFYRGPDCQEYYFVLLRDRGTAQCIVWKTPIFNLVVNFSLRSVSLCDFSSIVNNRSLKRINASAVARIWPMQIWDVLGTCVHSLDKCPEITSHSLDQWNPRGPWSASLW